MYSTSGRTRRRAIRAPSQACAAVLRLGHVEGATISMASAAPLAHAPPAVPAPGAAAQPVPRSRSQDRGERRGRARRSMSDGAGLRAVMVTLRGHEQIIDAINGQLQILNTLAATATQALAAQAVAANAATQALAVEAIAAEGRAAAADLQIQTLMAQAIAADAQLHALDAQMQNLAVQTAATARCEQDGRGHGALAHSPRRGVSRMAEVMERWHTAGAGAASAATSAIACPMPATSGADAATAPAAPAAATADPWSGFTAGATTAQRSAPPWTSGAGAPATGIDIRIDFRGTDRIKSFTGVSALYMAWKERMQEHMCRGKPKLESLIRWAEKSASRIDEAAELSCEFHGSGIDASQASSEVYSFLAYVIGDELRAKKIAAGAQRGLELWRSLYNEYEGNSAVVQLARLSRYLQPERAKNIESLSTALDKWEVLGAEVGSEVSEGSRAVAMMSLLSHDLAQKVLDYVALVGYASRLSFVRAHIAQRRDGALAKGQKKHEGGMDLDLIQSLISILSPGSSEEPEVVDTDWPNESSEGPVVALPTFKTRMLELWQDGASFEEENWHISLITSKPKPPGPSGPAARTAEPATWTKVCNRYQALAVDETAWPELSSAFLGHARSAAAACKAKATTAATAAVQASLRSSTGHSGRRACCLLQNECKERPLMSQQLEFAVGSGAVATVIPPHAVQGMGIAPSAGSKAGHCYHTADGGEIPNLGEVVLRGQTDDLHGCAVTAQVADIVMPLLSVACVSEQGNTFHFGARAGYIKHVASGRVTRLTKRGKLYHLKMWCEGHVGEAQRDSNPHDPICHAPLLAPLGPDGQHLPDVQTDEEEEQPAAEEEQLAAEEKFEEFAGEEQQADEAAGEQLAEQGAYEAEEATNAKVLKDPRQPTQQEVEEHCATHLPFRSWCSQCVRGRKKNPAHYNQKRVAAGSVPSVHLDYCFLRDGDEELLTVIVVRDKITGATFAAAVSKKGSADENVVEQTAEFVRRLGHPKLLIKSDQEPSIIDFSRAKSQSNGVAEAAVQIVEDILRTLKLGVERRVSAKLPCAHPAMEWLVSHAADVTTKYLRGRDGKTAYERLKGKPCREDVVEFGECILYRSSRSDEGKLAPRWEPAVWLGKRWGSTEHIVATEDGTVHHCRAVHRLPQGSRWDAGRIESIKGTPRCMSPSEDQHGVPLVLRPRPAADVEGGEAVMARAMREAVPRSFRIAKPDLVRWGYTANCPRCASAMRGQRVEGCRSEACRARLEEEMTAVNDPRPLRKASREDGYLCQVQEAAAAEQPAASEEEELAAIPMQQDNNSFNEVEHCESQPDNDDMASVVRVLLQLGLSKYEVHAAIAEIFSPSRVTDAAPKFRFAASAAYDLQVDASTGESWDFTLASHRARCRRHIASDKPLLVVASPPCTLSLAAEICATQARAGRYFLLQRPACDDNWQQSAILRLLAVSGVATAVGDMCAFRGSGGKEELVLKPKRWASNAPELLKRMGVRCSSRGGGGGKKHPRAALAGKTRTSRAAVRPARLCLEILRGLRNQLLCDGAAVGETALSTICDEEAAEEAQFSYDVLIPYYDGEFVDDISGEALPKHLVEAGRKLEMEFFHREVVYSKRPIAECWRCTGKAPVRTKWIDHNKGDRANPDVWCRLVACQYNQHKDAELYAATPPLEALRFLISAAATSTTRTGLGEAGRARRAVQRKLLFIDARRAYFNAVSTTLTYDGMCGMLNKCMYGTRDTARRWEETYSQHLLDLGFVQGRASPCCWSHSTRDIQLVVHGDDFTFIGVDVDLNWIQSALALKFEIKVRGLLGGGAGDVQEMHILKHAVQWTKHGITYEADQRHAELIIKEFGLATANSVVAAGEKDRSPEAWSRPLSSAGGSAYRSIVARINFLAQDRPDITFASKECCRDMSAPTENSWGKVKHIARYLVGKPRLVYEYMFQEHCDLDTYVGSDYAGDFMNRKSTSGGCIMRGTHLIKHWSNNQSAIALSSAESELYGVVIGATQTMGLQTIAGDLSVEVGMTIHTDSAAAKGVCERKGIGKVRHRAVSGLWIQDKIRSGEIQLRKVEGAKNPADVLTKHVEGHKVRAHLAAMHTRPGEGRASGAPVLGS
ncbi:unnamed protein product [Polarella glacialis]|uniref:Copia protein n=1 Tax=Polarella glacialis TaxID=89957 RepID=A0A813HB74_POLGL|nr:unnamed protein product [Polarella glacialis]